MNLSKFCYAYSRYGLYEKEVVSDLLKKTFSKSSTDN